MAHEYRFPASVQQRKKIGEDNLAVGKHVCLRNKLRGSGGRLARAIVWQSGRRDELGCLDGEALVTQKCGDTGP